MLKEQVFSQYITTTDVAMKSAFCSALIKSDTTLETIDSALNASLKIFPFILKSKSSQNGAIIIFPPNGKLLGDPL